MTNKQWLTCVQEVANYTSRESYVSDLALSSVWGDPDGADIPADRIQKLGDIWDVVNRSVKQIAADAGMSQRKLAERFCIPYRTMEDWGSKKSACPLYTRLMMQECLGLYLRDTLEKKI